MNSLWRNLKLLFTDDFSGRWLAHDERSKEMVARMAELETALNVRADKYEQAVDSRIDERLASIDSRPRRPASHSRNQT